MSVANGCERVEPVKLEVTGACIPVPAVRPVLAAAALAGVVEEAAKLTPSPALACMPVLETLLVGAIEYILVSAAGRVKASVPTLLVTPVYALVVLAAPTLAESTPAAVELPPPKLRLPASDNNCVPPTRSAEVAPAVTESSRDSPATKLPPVVMAKAPAALAAAALTPVTPTAPKTALPIIGIKAGLTRAATTRAALATFFVNFLSFFQFTILMLPIHQMQSSAESKFPRLSRQPRLDNQSSL